MTKIKDNDNIKALFGKRIFRRTAIVLISLFTLALCFLAASNIYITSSVSEQIISVDEASELSDVDCILVLGCLVKSNGAPSDMLSDRLERGVELYESGVAPKLLMSGDHGRIEYNEVGAMKQYALEAGVCSADIFMDHAGFSTYESMYRAKEIFGADKIVIVTQGYHLYRALYIAERLGIEAYGVTSDQRSYAGQMIRDVREALARTKDMLYVTFKPLPTYLGESISLSGDGSVTNG